METKINDSLLMDTIFRCLCRVLKNRKIYHRFKCTIGNGYNSRSIGAILNCMQRYVHTNKQRNPFFRAHEKADIFKILELSSPSLDDFNNVKKVQMRITHFINTLLHSCVENIVDNISEVEGIGKETFEMVCKQIYGDDFVDETENDVPEKLKKVMEILGYPNDANYDEMLKQRQLDFMKFIEETKNRIWTTATVPYNNDSALDFDYDTPF